MNRYQNQISLILLVELDRGLHHRGHAHRGHLHLHGHPRHRDHLRGRHGHGHHVHRLLVQCVQRHCQLNLSSSAEYSQIHKDCEQ